MVTLSSYRSPRPHVGARLSKCRSNDSLSIWPSFRVMTGVNSRTISIVQIFFSTRRDFLSLN
jgi:hypothetical protein